MATNIQKRAILHPGSRVVVAVGGGVAAYKSAVLVRELQKRECEVQVLMTPSACEFISPMTMQALSGLPVRTDLFDTDAEAAMGHIELARWGDLILVAPATADLLARLAQGRSNDLVSAVCLAAGVPVTVVPAMNRVMWESEQTRANCANLRAAGVIQLGPDRGNQACGETGAGRMLEPEAIVARLFGEVAAGVLSGKRVLVTAGPTHEPIDPVRFIGNRSSGRMGYAIAEAALEMGAEVVLVSGPVALREPLGTECIRVCTTQEMRDAVMQHVDKADVFIASAAVADYRVASTAEQKIKKQLEGDMPTLELARNPDILVEVANLPKRPLLMGFAAETQNLLKNARAKLHDKNLDFIVANDVSDTSIGFDSQENQVILLSANGQAQQFDKMSKQALSGKLMQVVAGALSKDSET